MSSDVKMALAKKYYRFKVRWQSRNLREDPSNYRSRIKLKVCHIKYFLVCKKKPVDYDELKIGDV